MIWEFKPDSPTGRAAYDTQRSRYLNGVNEYFTRHLLDGTVPTAQGGEQIIPKIRGNPKCWDPKAKKTTFEIRPHYYKVCEKKFECVQP